MLAELVQSKITEQNLSIREAARQIGLAHTTLSRIIGGEQVDLETYVKACEWLRVSAADVLHSEGKIKERSEIAAGMAALIAASPSLEPIFAEIVKKFEAGEISLDTVNDLIQYAAYRLGF